MELNLSSTFQHQGWTIKYQLTESPDPQAKPVVFVHGTPWSSAVYGPIIRALAARGSYRILAYDLPGYGQSQEFADSSSSTVADGDSSSPTFPGDTSIRFQASALDALLDHTNLHNPAAVAHDIAGTIVLRAHLLHGRDFSSMLLLDANAVLPWGDGFYQMARAQSGFFVQLPASIYESVLRAVIESACYNTKVLEAGWGDVLAKPWIDDGETAVSGGSGKTRQLSFLRQVAQANDADVAEMLDGKAYERVRCDVKIIWGEQDQWIPGKKIEQLVKSLGGRHRETVVVPDAGHLVMLDQPERVAIEVFDWLRR